MKKQSLVLGMCLLCLTIRGQAGDYLGDLTWPEAAQALPDSVVVIPFAAGAKQHGHHLPMNTDQRVMQYLLQAAVAVDHPILIAPPILHGWFPGFRQYPGTEVTEPTVFIDYVQGVAESLINHGARRVVLLNLGISRATGLPLAVVARQLRAEHDVHTLVVSWDDLETEAIGHVYEQARGGHADEGETSIMLYLEADAVRQDQLSKDLRQAPVEQIGYAPGQFERSREAGLYGDATLATAEKGEQILAHMRNNWLQALRTFMGRN